MKMSSLPRITVFFWPGSPWASKVVSYLALRGLPYTECHQPITMPRPDLENLGISYRRIPVVSIGRDIYCDTLLVLDKLEALFPNGGTRGSMSGKTPEHKALEKMLEKWTDVVVFSKAADCIPLDHPLVQDPKFQKDRAQLWGEEWDRETRAKKRPEGLVHMRAFFDFLEETLLADGREWVLGTKEPMLADIHSAWIFNWMLSLEGSFEDNIISKDIHPKVYAWCARYHEAVEAAQKAHPDKEEIDGAEALKRISKASFAEENKQVDPQDPLNLKKGQHVSLGPTDTGFTAQEKGPLIAVTAHEVVIGSKTKDGTEVHIHTPRWNFRVKSAGQ